jgi:hypothetical protein
LLAVELEDIDTDLEVELVDSESHQVLYQVVIQLLL